MSLIGCAAPHPRGGVICSIAGNDPFEVASPDDLDHAVTWVTSIDENEHSVRGLARTDHLKHASFLSVPLRVVIGEVGGATLTSAESVRHLSEIANRVISMTVERFGFDPANFEMKLRQAQSLPEALVELTSLRGHKSGFDSEETRQALISMRQYNRSGRLAADMKTVVVSPSRYTFAANVVACPLPFGPFEEIKLTGDRSDVLRWIKRSRPAFCRIRISSAEQALSRILPNRYLQGHEFNVAHPEFIVLSALAVIDVSACWMAETYYDAPAFLGCTLPAPTSVDTIGVSAGVMAEAYLRSLMLPIRGGSEVNGSHLVRSSWFASAARAEAMVSAIRLAKNGVGVHEFDGANILATISSAKDWFHLQTIANQMGMTACHPGIH